MICYRKTLVCSRMLFVGVFLVLSICHLITGASEIERVDNLMKKYPLIDGHNDLAIRLRVFYNNELSKLNLHQIERVSTDIQRLQRGNVQAQMFAAFVICGAQEKDAVRLTLEQIDVIRRMCTENKDLELVTSTEELKASKEKEKIACIISIEGGHSIDNSLPVLRMFYQLGVRSMTLTHSCNTRWAESSSKQYKFFEKRQSSLTDFGKAVVEEMNRLGMLVDISHTSIGTASAVLQYSKAPVIFSHSSSHSICNHSRNVPDSLLHKLKKNEGLIMVNLYTDFISCNHTASISQVADHFDHIKKIIGAESIGIGGDYDGVDRHPKGLEDVSTYPALIQELLKRNWTEDELAKVLRLNFLRVFEKVEEVRDGLNESLPNEVGMPLEEAHNSCRFDLRPKRLYSTGERKPSSLLLLASLSLLSSILF